MASSKRALLRNEEFRTNIAAAGRAIGWSRRARQARTPRELKRELSLCDPRRETIPLDLTACTLDSPATGLYHTLVSILFSVSYPCHHSRTRISCFHRCTIAFPSTHTPLVTWINVVCSLRFESTPRTFVPVFTDMGTGIYREVLCMYHDVWIRDLDIHLWPWGDSSLNFLLYCLWVVDISSQNSDFSITFFHLSSLVIYFVNYHCFLIHFIIKFYTFIEWKQS